MKKKINMPVVARRIKIVMAFLLILAFFYINLTSIPPSSEVNLAKQNGYDSGMAILENPVYGPQKAANYALFKFGINTEQSFRLVSASLASLAVISFYIMVKIWISRKIALLASVLFASSSWVILSAHSSGFMTSVLLVMPMLLLAATCLKDSKYDRFLPLNLLLVNSLLFMPFAWPLVGAFYILSAKDIFSALKNNNMYLKILLFFAVLIPIAVLAYGLGYKNNFKAFFGTIGTDSSFSLALDRFKDVFEQLFVSGVDQPSLWLFGTPLIDTASIIIILLGIFTLIKISNRPILGLSLLALMVYSLTFAGFSLEIYLGLLVPLLYILAAFGLYYLLAQWNSVFPKNPVVKYIGLAAVTLLVFGIASYHTYRFHIAWPRSYYAQEVFRR